MLNLFFTSLVGSWQRDYAAIFFDHPVFHGTVRTGNNAEVFLRSAAFLFVCLGPAQMTYSHWMSINGSS